MTMPTTADHSEIQRQHWALMQIDARLNRRFSETAQWQKHSAEASIRSMTESPEFRRAGPACLVGETRIPNDVVLASDPALPACWRELRPRCHGFWFRGSRAVLDSGRVRVAVIGSRHPRPDAVQAARSIAGALARVGITIVSGLAIGIDGCAHQAALDVGGSTIGVLATGVDQIYPAANRDLGISIAASPLGLVISEYPYGAKPLRYRFVERNRLIAALADYVVVVQAARKSGSMSTVQIATELGVPVGVVPSTFTDIEFTGSFELLRDGADCVVDGLSVLNALARHEIISPQAAVDSCTHALSDILSVPRTEDEVAALHGTSLADARFQLVEFEASRLVRRLADGRWIDAGRQ